MTPFARTHACFSLSFLLQTLVRAPSSEICVHRGSRSSISASTVATAAALSRRSDLGGGVSLDASRVIERLLLRFGTSFARRRVRGVARAVAASRKSGHVVRVRIFVMRARARLAAASLPVWCRVFVVQRRCAVLQLRAVASTRPSLAKRNMNGRLFTAMTRPRFG